MPGQLCAPNIASIGNLLEQAVLDHLARAAAAFFGGLEDQVDGAVEVAVLAPGAWPRPAASRCGRRGRRRASCRGAGWRGRRCCARSSAARRCRRAGRRRGRCVPFLHDADHAGLAQAAVDRDAPVGELPWRSRRRCAPPRSTVRGGRGCRAAWRRCWPRRRGWIRSAACGLRQGRLGKTILTRSHRAVLPQPPINLVEAKSPS